MRAKSNVGLVKSGRSANPMKMLARFSGKTGSSDAVYLLVGTQQMRKDENLKKQSKALSLLKSSLEESKTLMKESFLKILNILRDSKRMEDFLRNSVASGTNKKLALGALIAVLMQEQKVSVRQFYDYLNKAKERLRYITLDPQMIGFFEQVMVQMEDNKGKPETFDERVKRLGYDPYTKSKAARYVKDGQETVKEIDFFVSHCWQDSSREKVERLQILSEEFNSKHGRYPRIWMDVFCINQAKAEIEENVKLLPVFLMACRKMLVFMSPNFLTRLWCLAELYCRESMSVELENDLSTSAIEVQELSPGNVKTERGANQTAEQHRFTSIVAQYASRPRTMNNVDSGTPSAIYEEKFEAKLIEQADCGDPRARTLLQKKFKYFPGSWVAAEWIVKKALHGARWKDERGIEYLPQGFIDLEAEEKL